MTNPATAYVLARLAELEALQVRDQAISGQPPRAYDAYGASSFEMLPPPDEDSDVAGRIALYRLWLARHAEPAEPAELCAKWEK